jgi:hypothetical protein
MNLYLDTEFDGHGGKLISLALAADDGTRWYAIHPSVWALQTFDPWVAEHVMPDAVLKALPRTASFFGETEAEFRASLRAYLEPRPGATIWADWPDDFGWLMSLMSGPSYADSFMIRCTMQLIETPPGEPKPEIPHNALSDAIALMRWHQSAQNENATSPKPE